LGKGGFAIVHETLLKRGRKKKEKSATTMGVCTRIKREVIEIKKEKGGGGKAKGR